MGLPSAELPGHISTLDNDASTTDDTDSSTGSIPCLFKWEAIDSTVDDSSACEMDTITTYQPSPNDNDHSTATCRVSNCAGTTVPEFASTDTDSLASLEDHMEDDAEFHTLGIKSLMVDFVPSNFISPSEIQTFDAIPIPAPDDSEGPPCWKISRLGEATNNRVRPGQGQMDGGSQATSCPDTTYVWNYRPYGPDFPC